MKPHQLHVLNNATLAKIECIKDHAYHAVCNMQGNYICSSKQLTNNVMFSHQIVRRKLIIYDGVCPLEQG